METVSEGEGYWKPKNRRGGYCIRYQIPVHDMSGQDVRFRFSVMYHTIYIYNVDDDDQNRQPQ